MSDEMEHAKRFSVEYRRAPKGLDDEAARGDLEAIRVPVFAERYSAFS